MHMQCGPAALSLGAPSDELGAIVGGDWDVAKPEASSAQLAMSEAIVPAAPA
jgi:hypothetical protein